MSSQLQFHLLILGQIQDTVIAVDDQQRITYFNPAAERQHQMHNPRQTRMRYA